MSHHVLPGEPPVTVHLRRSARARRLSLRVSRLDGRVTLTAPHSVREAEALGFAKDKADWLRAQLARRPEEVVVGHGCALPIEGVEREVLAGKGRSVRLEGDAVIVPGTAQRSGARLRGFLRELARERLARESDFYAQRLGRDYSRITLRDTRSRWGSCSSRGALMFSWRLIMAPPEVLSYVAAHEVAHLAEMNHSASFWQQVERIHGDYDAPRRWLRQNGEILHRYQFGD